MVRPPKPASPMGGLSEMKKAPMSVTLEVDSFDGKIMLNGNRKLRPLQWGNQLFYPVLKTGHLFEPWIDDCPLIYKSPNAPQKVDVPGSIVLFILSSHKRYAHIETIISDNVNALILGMEKIVSGDYARRGLNKIAAFQSQLCDFLDSINSITLHLSPLHAWYRILTKVTTKFLKNGQVIAAQPLVSSG